MKTKKKSSGEGLWSPLVKISARSDRIIGWFLVSQTNALTEIPVLRKTRNKFDQCIFHQENLEVWFLRILWTVFHGESDEHIFKIFRETEILTVF